MCGWYGELSIINLGPVVQRVFSVNVLQSVVEQTNQKCLFKVNYDTLTTQE